MGTKKTMLVLACALVMVFAMSTCAFAGQGYGGSAGDNTIEDSFNYDFENEFTSITKTATFTKIGVDVDLEKTTNNNYNNNGIIAQDVDDSIIVGIDKIKIDVCLLNQDSYNDGSYNTYIAQGSMNEDYVNVGNTYKGNYSVNNSVNVTKTFTVDLDNVGNLNDDSTEYTAVFVKSFNGNEFTNDNDWLDVDSEIDLELELDGGLF